MGYHLLEPIRGSPDAPHILFWKRLGIDYELPIVPRDEAVPPNKLRLIVVKTVTDAGDVTREIGTEVEWDLYHPYGPAARESAAGVPLDEAADPPDSGDVDELLEQTAGELPIPPAFFDEYQLQLGEYLECFVLEVLPSGADEWIIPYASVRIPPKGGTPDFDRADVMATVAHREIELE